MGLLDPPPSTGGGNTHAVGGGELAWEEEDGDGVPGLPSSEGLPVLGGARRINPAGDPKTRISAILAPRLLWLSTVSQSD
jgi:hypothetical protein